MQSNLCKNCKNVYYDYFCSYKARWCKIHGCIDCNPDSYVEYLKKENKECSEYETK